MYKYTNINEYLSKDIRVAKADNTPTADEARIARYRQLDKIQQMLAQVVKLVEQYDKSSKIQQAQEGKGGIPASVPHTMAKIQELFQKDPKKLSKMSDREIDQILGIHQPQQPIRKSQNVTTEKMMKIQELFQKDPKRFSKMSDGEIDSILEDYA